MTRQLAVFWFLLGCVVATSVLWKFAQARERYRRSRVDLKMTVGGIRGQMETIRDNFLRMLKLGAYVLVAVVVIGFVLFGRK